MTRNGAAVTDIRSDREVAEQIAMDFSAVDMSDARPITYPTDTTMSGTVSGVSLGNSLIRHLEEQESDLWRRYRIAEEYQQSLRY